jgi:hypothetical protein
VEEKALFEVMEEASQGLEEVTIEGVEETQIGWEAL